METVLGRQSGAPRGLVRLGTSVAAACSSRHGCRRCWRDIPDCRSNW